MKKKIGLIMSIAVLFVFVFSSINIFYTAKTEENNDIEAQSTVKVDENKNVIAIKEGQSTITFLEKIKTTATVGTFITAMIASIITVKKYLYEKKRDLYLKELNEVYAPLYCYIVKQEVTRNKIIKNDSTRVAEINYDKNTILSITEKGTTKKCLDRNYLIEISQKANKSLMSYKLMNLLSTYEIMCGVQDTVFTDDEYNSVAKEIIIEVISQYTKCMRGLKLEKTVTLIDDVNKLTLENILEKEIKL